MTTETLCLPWRLRALATTALMLEKLERMPRSASADQYRALVLQLQALLAELHENRHCAHAGLCRAPLDLMVGSERLTQALLSSP